ncbi:PKD domain-containing protein [Haloprofundus halobius]|uniref:PKD domain-containing protein n=1 Tax=Haloprofundus halobius TaxID=2876194 RepID=UPI001CCDF434|nr:PKD domain-containing protein [Haloprofundus halobius]
MDTRRIFVVLLVVVAATPSNAVGTSAEPPLAEAGLDQTVERGTTVLLDGTGSRDPDGEIASYRWSIRGPDGRAVVPENASAPRTSFVPDMVGTFDVTLTVADDDGETSTDTLYVTVEPGDSPSVRLTGPEDGVVGHDRRFTAEVTPGAAPLDTVVWRVDGTVVSRRSLSPDAGSVSFEMPFEATGTHDVSATVCDSDNRSDTDSHSISISARTPPSSGGSDRAPDADSNAAVVSGDRVVTETRPLEGAYRVDGVPATDISDVEWYSEQGSVGDGTQLRREWSPGTHSLYAVVRYDDGSREVARFEGDETSVVADPRPNASVADVSLQNGPVSGTAVGDDDFGNLRALSVSLDGTEVASWTGPGDGVEEKRLSFDASATPQEEHVLEVTAVDARGQERTFTRTVVPKGTPEIVSSRFLNTPVDSYHERIDSERYVAYHEMRIDLNGVDPEDVSWDLGPKKDRIVSVADATTQQSNDELVIRSKLYGSIPGIYEVESRVWSKTGGKTDTIESSTDFLEVNQNPPELRVNISYHNEKRVQGDRPVIIDASDSFDPDGTAIQYRWRDDMEPGPAEISIGDATNLDSMRITILDGYGNSVSKTEGLENYYTPQISEVSVADEKDVYLPEETVELRVISQEYTRIGNPNRIDIRAEILGHGDAVITNWFREVRTVTDNHDGEQRWTGTIEVPASALQDGANNPSIQIYNAENPETTIRSEKLPSVTVYEPTETRLTNGSVDDLEYTLLDEEYDWRQTTDYTTQREYRDDGYVVDSTDRKGIEYEIEQYEKTQSAKHRTETKRFDRYSSRELLLDTNSDWTAAGSETTTDVWHTTETEWRDSRGGEGTFTGDTRTVQVEPAQYRTERQFEYDRSVRKTGTRTVMKTRTRTTTEQRRRPVTRCTQFGCFETTETYIVTEHETVRVPVTETYSYTTTVTETYWSTQPLGSDHHPTGDIQRVKTSPAEYEKQYQYEYRERHEETTTTYLAEKRELVRPAQYDWVHYETTTSGPRADQIARHDDFRVGSTSNIRRWFMKKKISESKETSSTYDDADDVIRTRATVSGEVEQTLTNPKTGEMTTQTRGEFDDEFIGSGLYTRSEILEDVGSSDGDTECGNCGGVR